MLNKYTHITHSCIHFKIEILFNLHHQHFFRLLANAYTITSKWELLRFLPKFAYMREFRAIFILELLFSSFSAFLAMPDWLLYGNRNNFCLLRRFLNFSFRFSRISNSNFQILKTKIFSIYSFTYSIHLYCYYGFEQLRKKRNERKNTSTLFDVPFALALSFFLSFLFFFLLNWIKMLWIRQCLEMAFKFIWHRNIWKRKKKWFCDACVCVCEYMIFRSHRLSKNFCHEHNDANIKFMRKNTHGIRIISTSSVQKTTTLKYVQSERHNILIIWNAEKDKLFAQNHGNYWNLCNLWIF